MNPKSKFNMDIVDVQALCLGSMLICILELYYVFTIPGITFDAYLFDLVLSISVMIGVATFYHHYRGITMNRLRNKNNELVRTEQNLRETTEKLRVMGNLTRHDLGNKLSTILNNAYLIQKNGDENNNCFSYYKEIENASDDVKRIFNFSRVYEQLGTHKQEYCKVEDFFNKATLLFTNLDRIEIENNCIGFFVKADSLLTSLFYNLIDNSVRHGKHVSKIRLYTEENEDHLNLIYEDNGVGIPAEAKENIFFEGYGENTGYGLYLIKRMCHVYGWTIMENGELGKGVRFIIKIPKIEKQKELEVKLRLSATS